MGSRVTLSICFSFYAIYVYFSIFVLQALLTGVSVVCTRDPALDPYEFIVDKLRELQAGQHEDLAW